MTTYDCKIQVGEDGVWLVFPKIDGEKEFLINLNNTFKNTYLGNQALTMIMENAKHKEGR